MKVKNNFFKEYKENNFIFELFTTLDWSYWYLSIWPLLTIIPFTSKWTSDHQ